MKEIKALIQPFMADNVIDSLREIARLPGIVVSPVNAFSRGDPNAVKYGRIGDRKIFVCEAADVIDIRAAGKRPCLLRIPAIRAVPGLTPTAGWECR